MARRAGKPAAAGRHVRLDDVALRLGARAREGVVPLGQRGQRAEHHALGVAAERRLDHPVLPPRRGAVEPARRRRHSRRRDPPPDGRRLAARELVVVARQLAEEREQALGLRHDGARVVQPQEAAGARRQEQRARRGEFVQELARILPQHDVDRRAEGDGPAAVHAQVVRTGDDQSQPSRSIVRP